MIDVIICIGDKANRAAAKQIIKEASIANYTILDNSVPLERKKIKMMQAEANATLLPLVSLRTGDYNGITEKTFRTGRDVNALASLMLEIQSYVEQLIKNNESTNKAVE